MKTQDLLQQWEQSAEELQVKSGLSAGEDYTWGDWQPSGGKVICRRAYTSDGQYYPKSECTSCTLTITASPCWW